MFVFPCTCYESYSGVQPFLLFLFVCVFAADGESNAPSPGIVSVNRRRRGNEKISR